MARQKRELHFTTKVINGIAFTSHDYQKGKYLITAKGYEGERWVGYDTWEKRNDGDMTDGRSSFSPKNKRWFQASFKEESKQEVKEEEFKPFEKVETEIEKAEREANEEFLKGILELVNEDEFDLDELEKMLVA